MADMPDVKFMDCLLTIRNKEFRLPSDPGLLRIAESWLENHNRAFYASCIPSSMVFSGIWTTVSFNRAAGNPVIMEELTKSMTEHETLEIQKTSHKIVATASDSSSQPKIYKGLEAILCGIATTSWTAFETLASDL